MKKSVIALILCLSTIYGFAQDTNKILSTGNVGIGTTTPNFKLDVSGNSNVTGQSWFSYGNNNLSGYSWTNAALTTNSIEIVNSNGIVSNLSPTLVFHRNGTGGPQFRLAADGSNILYLESAGGGSSRSPLPYGGGPNSYFSKLHIDASLTTTGNVGIGTTNPNFKLDVAGKSNITGQSWFSYGNNNMSGYSWTNAALTTNSIEIVNNNDQVSNLSPTLAFHTYGNGGPQFRLAADGSKVLYLESSGAGASRSPLPYGGGPNSYFSRLHIDASLTTTGKVGIGTDTFGEERLAVNGKIHAKEVKIDNDNWPDYVFHQSYKAKTLPEIEVFIKRYNHLPEIPTAAEVAEKGIELGEMNAKLLKKIEELTLHLIEKDKQLNKQEVKIKAQDERMDKFESLINGLQKK